MKSGGIVVLMLAWAGAVHAGGFESGRAAFDVTCDPGGRLEYRIQSVCVLPAEHLCFTSEAEGLVFEAEAGAVTHAEGAWRWQAPGRPGIYRAAFRQPASGQALELRLLVLVPSERLRAGWLQGFRVGAYPPPRPAGRDREALPKGFVEVTPANQDVWLSPHFQLKHFICKQPGPFPKYICLDENLLLKLEVLLERLHARFGVRRLAVMSGYRTPDYNRSLGDAAYSSHMWGRAADVYADNDGDGCMDDLNADGRHDWRDAQRFYEVADDLDASGLEAVVIGGIGVYDRNRHHGPFVHVDTRGYRARWGLLPERRLASHERSVRPD